MMTKTKTRLTSVAPTTRVFAEGEWREIIAVKNGYVVFKVDGETYRLRHDSATLATRKVWR